MRRIHKTVLALAVLALCGRAAPAQLPDRPRLPAGSDVNDWEPYYDLGTRVMRNEPRLAAAAFFWAARLDPTRAEPPFAQWVTFWLLQDERKFSDYMKGNAKVLRSPDVAHADSLRTLAFTRNPFVHQGLFLLVIDELPGAYREDVVTQGWIAYANADLTKALERFGLASRRDPERFGYLHYLRASALVGLSAYDSATAELDTYIRQLRDRDTKKSTVIYESKALLEYAQGLLFDQMRKWQAADDAFGRSLAEDMSFAPAHSVIGRRALARGRVDDAIRELGLALEVDSTDVVTRLAMGDALMRQSKPEEAAEHYRRAVAAEPYYAEGVYRYAVALDQAGHASDAAIGYARAIELGARYWVNGAKAQKRLAAIKSGG